MLSGAPIQGGIFHDSIDGGRAGCSIVVGAAGLKATLPDGTVHELPVQGMQVEMGGSSGKMLFCRNPDRSLTIFTEDTRLAQSLLGVAPAPLATQLQRLTARANRGRMLGLAVVGVIVAAIVALAVSAPTILRWGAKSVVEKLPYEVDQTLGDASIKSMDLGGTVIEDPSLVGAAETIVERLEPEAKALAPHFDIKYTVKVVQSPQANAFALPGGHIVVYTGLMEKANRPEQVAGVLAHEISHVIRRHGLRRIAQSLGTIGAIQVLLGDAGGLVGLGKDLLTLAAINDYSQEQESQADDDAVTMMVGAGLDPRALGELFALMKEDAAGQEVLEALPWLSSHPNLGDRIEAIEAQIPEKREKKPLPIDWAAVDRALDSLPGKAESSGSRGAEKQH